MKIRTSFVSNSSSSSFVVLGVTFPKHKLSDDRLNELLKTDYNYFDEEKNDYTGGEFYCGISTEDGCPDEHTAIFGKLIAETEEDDGFESKVMSIEGLKKDYDKILKLIPELSEEERKLKIITGTRMC